MSKIEESANKFVNSYTKGGTKQSWLKEGYITGYHQAEKDLELTVEDIKTIDKLLNQYVDYSNPYQEVLKRFKDYLRR